MAPRIAPSDPADVEALVSKAQMGDRDAFAVLYRMHAPLVRSILLAWAAPDDVPDLAQETFLTAMRKLSALRDRRAFPQWLGTIARNTARAHHRGSRASVPLTDDIPATPVVPLVEDETTRVLSVIHALPSSLREPLLLRLVEGMPGEQISKVLGISHGAVRVALHRALKLLRDRLEDQ